MNFNVKMMAFMAVFSGLAVATAKDATIVAAAPPLSGYEVALPDQERAVLGGIYVPEAQRAEAQSALQKSLETYRPVVAANPVKDRYGRIPVQAWRDGSGRILQPQLELLRAGLAFIWPPTGEEGDLAAWFKAEDVARQVQRGLWQSADFADLPAARPEAVLAREGRFAFVIGKVTTAARIKNKVYLHFGDDWRHDVTIEIAAHDLRDFRHAGIDPVDDYTQHPVRVRGWVTRDYGPMITVTHPSQIQRLDEARPDRRSPLPRTN